MFWKDAYKEDDHDKRILKGERHALAPDAIRYRPLKSFAVWLKTETAMDTSTKILKFIQRKGGYLSDETNDKINLSLKTYYKKRRFKPTDIKKYISLLDRQILTEKQISELKYSERVLTESLKTKLDDDIKQKIAANYPPRRPPDYKTTSALRAFYRDYFMEHNLEYKKVINMLDENVKELSNLKTMRNNLTETMLKGIF